MPAYVALLRAVNLAGFAQVRMSDLQACLSAARFENVRTLLPSGNVVFRSDTGRPIVIEQQIERAIAASLGLRTEVFVRTKAEWGGIMAQNPFPREALRDPSHLTVLVLKEAPPDRAWAELQSTITGRELVRGLGRHGYVTYPDGIGRSRLTPKRLERALGTRGTTRNWNTVTKLGSLVAQ
ncbi:MAG: DUF1697 domain-containing protein [Thermoplasmata archaeon]